MKPVFMSHRPAVMGTNWMITSDHPLASQAGAAVLEKGGNAVDAAIAANAALCIVRPHMCGIGGDLFLLLYWAKDRGLNALNASGRSPYRATPEFYTQKGLKQIPAKGILPITVPGTVDGWVTAHEKYGTIPLEHLLQRAIEYGEKGFPIYQELSQVIQEEMGLLRTCPASEKIFLKGGQVPKAGDLLIQKDLAESFREVARGGRDVFYKGKIGRALVSLSERNEGLFSEKDLLDHSSNWVEPLVTTYKGHEIYVMPPNSQGIALLMQANMIENEDLSELGHQTVEFIHFLVEAKKLAFADRDRYVSDPDFNRIPVGRMISKRYGKEQMARIDPNRAASQVSPSDLTSTGEDTVYLAAVDRDGNVVSMINSLYETFGSGMTMEGTGILLHNRGKDFFLDPNHFNGLKPYKRPYHTLSPAMVFKGERPFMALGTPGADGQTQTLMQILIHLIDFGADIQEAIESPRWRSNPGNHLYAEGRFSSQILEGLKAKGHQIEVLPDWSSICGGAQGIVINRKSGVLMGGADPRRQAYVIGC